MAMMITSFAALGVSVAAEGEYFTITANNRNLFINVNQKIALKDISVVINDVALSGNEVAWTSADAAVSIADGNLIVSEKGMFTLNVKDASGNAGTVTVLTKLPEETEYVLYEENFDGVANGTLPEGWTEVFNADKGTAPAGMNTYVDNAQVKDGKLYIGNGINNGYNYVYLPEFLDAFPDTQVSASMAQTWVNNNMRAGGIVTRGSRELAAAHPKQGYRIFIRRATTGGDGMRLTSLARIDQPSNKTDKALPFPIGSTRGDWSRPDCTVEHWDPNQQPSPWYTPCEPDGDMWKAKGYYVTWDVTTTDDRYTIDAYKSFEQNQFGGDMGPGNGGAWWETYHLKGDPSLEGYEMDVDLTKWLPEDRCGSGAIGFFTSGVQLAVDSVKVTVPVSILNANPDKYEFIPDPALATYVSQKIGVLSDVHLQVISTPADYALKNALTNMKNDGVSAILFTGDIVNTGVPAEYEKFLSIWDSVFPDEASAPKRLTITGNHEYEGVHFRNETYDDVLQTYLDAFGYDEPNFHEVVNGIHVIGITSEDHAVDGLYTMETTGWLEEELEAAKADNPYGPIIVMCHQTIKNTTYGSQWGSSKTAELNTLLKDYPQVVYLAGHSHFDFTNEKSIMQKDYTCIDVPSLQYTSTETITGGSTATEYDYQNYLMLEFDGAAKTMSVKRMKSYEKDAATHAFETVQVKDPWVLNLPIQKKSQFTYTAERAEAVNAPVFAEDAAVEALDVTSSTAQIKYPAASHEDYVHAYYVTVTDAAGSMIQQQYFVSDFYKLGDKKAEYVVGLEGLPSNSKLTVSITAMESFGKVSDPISVDIVTDPISTPSVGNNVADFLDVNTAVGFTDSSPFRRSHSLYVKSHPIKLYDDETLGRQVAFMKGWVNYPVSQGDFKEITNSFTVEVAFKTPAELAKSQCIFGNPESGGITVEFNGDGQFQVGAYIQAPEGASGSGYKYINVGELAVDTWYHAVYTFDGEKSVLYLNGEKAGEVDFAGTVKHNASVNFLTIGANVNAAGNAAYVFGGSVSVARVYTYALDRSQAVAALGAWENDNMINALYQKWLALYNAKENYALTEAQAIAINKLMTKINLAIHSTALTEEIAAEYIADANAMLVGLTKYDAKAPYVLFEDPMNDFTKIHSGDNYNGLQWENNNEIKKTLVSKQNNAADYALVYKLPGNVSEIQLDALSVSVYDKNYLPEHFTFFVSNDGETWTEVAFTASEVVPNAITAYWNEQTLTAKVDGEYKFVKIQLNVFGQAIDENGAVVDPVNWTTVMDGVRIWYVEDGVEIYEPNFAEITSESNTAGYAKLGKSAKVTVKASGDGLTYQWYVKNAGADEYVKSSITSASYSVKMSDKVKGRRVYCVVTDKYGYSVQSKTFILRESVSILTAPKSAKAAIGKTVKTSVKASGDGLTYTWYFKNAGKTKFSKSSVKSATYSTKMSKSANGRQVYCVITDKYGNKVTTSTVKLTKK
ncbi:MAG: metallophosphoesterase [Clostridia bacterium]|nr:metallophosphoesterase [Clostridia bacterium]